MKKMTILFFGHGNTLQNQYDGTTRSTDIDRFIGGVQHEHRRVQHMAINIQAHFAHRR
ncbi:MAG: hypothetical protein JOZ80_11490 [Acidobacteriaceae bacterium]|nr:hypothetical protein [Acidobacteriaceae bacterium]